MAGQPHPIYNLGNPRSENLGHCLGLIERALGKSANRQIVALPTGDRFFSRADVFLAERHLDYTVSVSAEVGISHLVDWYVRVSAPINAPCPAPNAA